MLELKAVQEAVAKGDYQYTGHAFKRTTERRISRDEIEQAIANAEIIEDYPDDKYGPSCLLYSIADNKRPLHIQVSAPPHVKIITAYDPNPAEWEENQKRR